jgi:pimeloyl-ACP methyl ester carboxylesterase
MSICWDIPGAIYSIEAAKRAQIAGLILYEPPLHAFHGRFVDEIWDRIHSAAEADRYEKALNVFLAEEAMLPDEVIADIKTTPLWNHMLERTPHSVTEWEALVHERLVANRYADISVPTLLLAGTATEHHPSFATQSLHYLLPNARMAWLNGEGHAANLTSPELVAQEVIDIIQQSENGEAQ